MTYQEELGEEEESVSGDDDGLWLVLTIATH